MSIVLIDRLYMYMYEVVKHVETSLKTYLMRIYKETKKFYILRKNYNIALFYLVKYIWKNAWTKLITLLCEVPGLFGPWSIRP